MLMLLHSQNLSIYNALLGLLGALIGLLGSASIGIIAIAFTIHRLRSPGGAKPLMIDFASSPGLQKTLDALAAGWDAGKLLWMLLLLLALNQLANSSINGLLVATPIDDEAIILVPYPTLAGRPSRLRRFEAAYQMLKGNTSANLDEAPFDSLPMEIPFIYDAATSVAGDNSVAGLDRSLTRGPNTAYLQDTHQLVNGMATSGSDLTGIASIWRQVELFPEILDTVSNGIPGFKRLLGEDATTVRSCAPVTDITMTCDSSWQPGRRTVNYEWCSETVQPWTPSEEYASDASADACTYRDGTPSFVLGVYANTSLTIEEQASDFTPQAGTYLHTCNVTLAESIRLIEVPLNVTTGISRQESRILNTAVVGKECTEYAAPGRPSVASDVTLSLLHGLATYFSYEFSLVSRSSSLLPVPTPMSTVLRRAQVGYQERNITQAGRLDQEMMTAVLVKSLGVMVNGVYGQTLTSTDFVDMLNDGSAQRYRTSLVRPGYAINPNGIKLLWTLPLLVIAIYSAVAAVLAFKSSSRRINLNSASTLLDLGVKSEARYAQVDVQPVAWRIDEKPDGRFSATQIMV